MTLFQISFKNVCRDKHTYFSYFISSTVTILLFYLFTAAAMHPALSDIQNGSTLALALGAGNFVIYVFAFLFIGYSSWAFLGSRGKQLGIYTILGMSAKQMKQMIFVENLLIGISALVVGTISGVLFSRMFFKLIRNIFATIAFEMYIPVFPLLITVVLFLFLFLLVGIMTSFFVSHKKVLWFLKRDKAYAENIKVSPIKLGLSIVLLGMIAFIMVPQVGSKLEDLWTPVVFLLMVGCIFLITPQMGAIYIQRKRRSKKHFRGIHLFADSEIATTLKENGHMMSLNAILLAMAFLAICGLSSMQSNVLVDVKKITPFAYTYIERPDNIRAKKDIAYLDQELLSKPSIQKVQYSILREDFTYGFLSTSDFNKILSVKGKKKVHMGKDEILVLAGNPNMDTEQLVVREDVKQVLKDLSISATKVRIDSQRVSTSGSFQEIYVVNDENWNTIKQNKIDGLYIETYTGYEDGKWLEHLGKADQLEKAFAHDDRNYDYTYAFTTLGNYYNTELLVRKLCTFVGFSISLIFLVASISLVYFRLYTSLEREKKKYDAMYKLGFSKKEMQQSVANKMRALLWIPFLIAMLILWMGVLYIDSQRTVSSFGMAVKYSVIFVVVYFVFYSFVKKIYQRKLAFDW